MRSALIGAAVALVAAAPAAAAGRCGSHPWCDTSLTPDARAGLLLEELTQDEKISLLAGDDPFGVGGGEHSHTGTSDGIPRVDIPTTYYSDGPVGPRQGKTTAMPVPMALAATFDPGMAYRYGDLVGNEVKFKGNDVVFAPTVNIMRTPLGGRTFEGYGEDPYLVARLAVKWVEGAQAQGVIGDIKHFAANNQEGKSSAANAGGPGQPLGPPAEGGNRLFVNSIVDERALREIYLPQFEAAVKEANVGSIMCSYNRLNGQYACENEELLQQILRRGWGFKGYVLADYGAAHPNGTNESLNNGLDFEPWPGWAYNPNEVNVALAAQKVSTQTLDEHIRNILRTDFAFGFFDRPAFKDDDAQIQKAPHAATAQDVEESAITLLTNKGGLPLDASKLKTIAVIGEAKEFKTGGGSGAVTPFAFVSPFDAITKRAGSGVQVTYDDGSDAQRAAEVAKASDVAIVFAGDYQSEGADKECMTLECPPYNGDQDGMIDAVAGAQPNTILVLQTGGPVLTPWRDKVKALLEAWYPGQQGGPAIARVLFGDVDPGGRLPATFPRSEADEPTAGDPEKYPGTGQPPDVVYKEGVLVGYRWWDENKIEPAFAFGHGLSYTTFAYRHLKVRPDVGGTLPLRVSVEVENVGDRFGVAVPQLYLGLPAPKPGVIQPPKQLKGMRKLELKAGERRTVSFPVDQRAFSYWDTDADDWRVAAGCYRVMVGRSSRDITGMAVVAVDGERCAGQVAAVHVAGACKRSVLIHLNHVDGRIRRVVARVGKTRLRVRRRGDAVRVVIGGTRKVTTVRLVVSTSRGTVRLKRRFRTCVRHHP